MLGVGYVRMATLTGMVDLLRDWTPEAGATLGRLCEAIARIRRADVLDEPMFRHALGELLFFSCSFFLNFFFFCSLFACLFVFIENYFQWLSFRQKGTYYLHT